MIQNAQFVVAVDELYASVVSLLHGNLVPAALVTKLAETTSARNVHFLDPHHLLLHQAYNRIQLVNLCNLLVDHLLPFPPLAQNSICIGARTIALRCDEQRLRPLFVQGCVLRKALAVQDVDFVLQ
jgi:hypothetical protein